MVQLEKKFWQEAFQGTQRIRIWAPSLQSWCPGEIVSYAHTPGADSDYVSITSRVVRPQCIVRGKRASPTLTAAVGTILEELLVMLGAMGCSGQRRRGWVWGCGVVMLFWED